jgi:hypothetical protein
MHQSSFESYKMSFEDFNSNSVMQTRILCLPVELPSNDNAAFLYTSLLVSPVVE